MIHHPEVSAAELTALHARLVDAATRDRAIDIAYRTLDTPVGALLLAATGAGLVRVAYAAQGHEAALHALATQISPRVMQASKLLDPAAREIDEYFAGTRRVFDLALDLRLAHGFRRDVLDHLPQIRYGQTESYAQVAAAAGSPRAVRAVGTACALNPLPIVVPCHRVVRSDGSPGRYAGGSQAKLALLALEAS